MFEMLCTFASLSFALSLVTIFATIRSTRNAERMLDEKKKSDILEGFAKSRGWRNCGVCGKLYEPLNDENYQPELDICRDCLWKVHYESTFKEEDSRI